MSAGQDYTEDQPPLVLTSVNGGVAWSKQTPPGLPTFGFLYGTGCTGEGDNALCVATGEDFTGDQPPFLVVSRRENGNTLLTRLALKDLDSSGVLWGVGCTGSGSSAICTAVGQDYADNLPPLLIVSTDGGSNWTRSTISGMPASGYFNAASCTGSGSSAICIAVGQDYKGDQPPLLYVSRDGAQNWSRVTSSDFPATGVFWGSSCTGSGDDAVCTAVGEDDTSGTAPLLLITRDGGRNWAKNTPSEMTTSGALWVTACTDGGVHAVCTIAGQDNTGKQPPILFVTKDGAQSWTKLVPTGLPIYGYIDATSCTGSGATAICTAIGQDYSGSQPAVIFENKDGVDSMDQSALWVEQTLPETKNGVMLVASGASGAGSSSNSSSGGAGKAVLRHQ